LIDVAGRTFRDLFVRPGWHSGRMRGMTDTLTIGERVAWYRRRRGMTQEVLAGLVARTVDWLGKVENNRIPVDRLSVLKSLAEALDVTVGDLIAEPSLLEWTHDSGQMTVPALRAALMDYRQGLRRLDTAPPRQADPRSGTCGTRCRLSWTPTNNPGTGTSLVACRLCWLQCKPPTRDSLATTGGRREAYSP